MTKSTVDTERVSVRAYLPAYQREEWDDHAEELDMSRSEFVRTMVQAGRRHFDGEVSNESSDAEPPTDDTTDSPATGDSDGGPELADRVIDILVEDEFLTWDELVAQLTDDVEQRLETALEELQASNTIRYSGRNGGYTLQHEQ